MINQIKTSVQKNFVLTFTVLLTLFCGTFNTYAQQKQPVDYADPMIGTSESRWMLNPGASMPFGMVQLSPDNQSTDWKSGYEYAIESISGFSHIHAWTMAGLSVMPTIGALNPKIYPPDAPSTTGKHRAIVHVSISVQKKQVPAIILPT
jgi:putative alpha-1,2-mannosidase